MACRALLRADDVADGNLPAGTDVGAQATERARTRQLLKVVAGRAEANAAALDLADAEALADERLQADAAGDDVAAALARREGDAGPFELLQVFHVNEGQLAAVASVGVEAGTEGVAIAFEPRSGDSARCRGGSSAGRRRSR